MNFSFVLCCIASLLLAAPLRALQGPQLDDTTWLLKGSAKLSSPQIGNETVKGYLLARFDGNGVLALEDGAGYVINGSWNVDGGGLLVVEISPQDVEDFLADNLPPAALAAISDISVTAIDSSASLKSKNGVGNLGLKLAFTLEFEVDGENGPVSVKLAYKLSVKGKGDVTGQPPAGATWLLASESRLKTGKVKLSGTDDLELVLGPDDGLPGDSFSLRRQANGLEILAGYYTLVAGALLLKPDVEALESYVHSLISPNVDAYYPGADLFVYGVMPTFSGKVKNGVLTLRGKTRILGSFDTYDPRTDEYKKRYFKGSYTLTGVGTE